MKKLISFLAMTTSTSLLFLGSLCASSTVDSLLFDIPEETVFPQNVRILTYPPGDLSTCNVLGLDQLKASGSGQFSEKGFSELVKALSLQSEQLIICDLRAEYHGLVNGLPMCWIDKLDSNDFFNQTAEEIELDEYRRLELALETGYVWIDQGPEQVEQFAWAVSQVTTERAFVEGLGHIYVRFPVETGKMPNDQLMDQFVQFVNCLSPDQWLHFHCQAGQQRTVLFLILLDIIKNSHQVSLEDIFTRHQLINGLDWKDLYPKGNLSERDEQEKFDFLAKFYLYCQQVPDFKTPWSEWIQKQSVLVSYPSDAGMEKEIQSTIQIQENTQDCLISKNETKETSDFCRDMFSPIFKTPKNNKLLYKRSLSNLVSKISKTLSKKSFKHRHSHGHRHRHSHGHRHRHSHGHRGGNHGHDHRYSAKIIIKKEWGGKESTPWEYSVVGDVHDGKGNNAEVEVTQRSDGTGKVIISGEHEGG